MGEAGIVADMQTVTPLLLTTLLALAACDRGPTVEAPAAQSELAPSAATPAAPAPHVAEQPTKPAKLAHSPAGASAEAPSAPETAGLAWKPPANFVAVPPANPMRKAQYKISKAQNAPELVVHYFGPGQGGGIEQNIERWIGQIKQADGSNSKRAAQRKTIKSSGDIKVHTLDVTGTFSSNMPGQATSSPRENSRLLGAIAEGPQGAVFFKVVGPAEAVGAAKESFDALVQSIHPK